jgi:ATP-binding cassette, subfamily B, bacterial
MGFFSGLNAEKYDRKYSDRELFRRIISYFKPYIKPMTLIAFFVLLNAAISSIIPIILSRGVDIIEKTGSAAPIVWIAGGILVLGVASWVINWVNGRLNIRTLSRVVITLAKDAYTAAAKHDLSFYDNLSSGRVVSRITTDTQDFGSLVSIVTNVVSQIVEAGILGVVLVQTEWRLSLYIFAIIPLVFALSISYRHLARKVTQQGMRSMANVNATIKETVSGIAVAKNFRQESSIYKEFNKANQTSFRVNVVRGLVMNMLFPILTTIGGVTSAVLIYTGGMSAIQGVVTAGAWYLFLLSLDRFLFPILNLSSFWTSIQNGLAASERVFALIDAEPAVVQTGNNPVPELKGKISFNNVTFQYKESETLLDNFSLEIAAGENLAIVGHTGAGKTSIARIIERFYEFQKGAVLIDGHDIRSFNLNEYRRQLGIVSQVPFLFSGTVKDNIRYARPDASDSEIITLANQIGDGEWLGTLPQGLITEVGERGTRLSMGQRQLVSLMRVLVQKPAIFILDEATASIDPFTEWQIQQALNLILARSTSILIAHRLSTVKTADRIITLEKGKIIEEGNHENLLARGGHYATLYNTYFRHQSLAYVEQAKTLVESIG